MNKAIGTDEDPKTRFIQIILKVAFFNATKTYNPTKVKECLDKGVNPNSYDEFGEGALHWLAEKGEIATSIVILSHSDAKIDITTKTGTTPLMTAAFHSRRKFVQFLLERGANPDCVNDKGETALHMAARNGNLPIVFDLVRYGATTNIANIYDSTPLSLVVIDHPSMVVAKFLLRKGARIRGKKNFPLLLECVLGCFTQHHIRVIDILLTAGMDLFVVHPFSKMNCLHMICLTGYIPLARYLLQKGADLEAVDFIKRTPKMTAKQHCQWELFKLYRNWNKKDLTVTWQD